MPWDESPNQLGADDTGHVEVHAWDNQDTAYRQAFENLIIMSKDHSEISDDTHHRTGRGMNVSITS